MKSAKDFRALVEVTCVLNIFTELSTGNNLSTSSVLPKVASPLPSLILLASRQTRGICLVSFWVQDLVLVDRHWNFGSGPS